MSSPIEPENDDTDLKREMRDIDMNIALSIAGFAGVPTRDRHGNITSEIWTKSNDSEFSAAKLLDFNDMRSMLKNQLSQHLEARKDLLLESDTHSIVARWIFDFAEAWEKEYENRSQHGWDIAQNILTAMEEALYEVKIILNELHQTDIHPDAVQRHIQDIIDQTPNKNIYTNAYKEATSLWFRNRSTGTIMILIAEKNLQTQIVCNRSGAYSARVQRNDVQQEVDTAVDVLYNAVMEDDACFTDFENLVMSMKNDKNSLKWLLDHTRSK